MSIPSSTSVARWRHLVRVAVRLVGVALIGVGVAKLLQAVVFTLFDLLQGNGISFGWNPALVIVSLLLTPVIWGAMGVTLIRLDRRLARLIVPEPDKGCPSCGYWIGSREIRVCPECGTPVTEDAP